MLEVLKAYQRSLPRELLRRRNLFGSLKVIKSCGKRVPYRRDGQEMKITHDAHS
jgi:hypothetical protein